MQVSDDHVVVIESIERSLILRFARPEIRNPLSIAVLAQLRLIVDDLIVDTSVERLILTGTGNVFASGADLREIGGVSAEDARGFALRGQTLMSAIASLPQVTIAAVNGFCYGGALDLALACDHRIASPEAQFAHPGTGLGIITGWGGTQRLPRLIGEAAALEMFLTAGPVDANRALQWGLIDGIEEDVLTGAMVFEPSRGL